MISLIFINKFFLFLSLNRARSERKEKKRGKNKNKENRDVRKSIIRNGFNNEN